MAICTLTLLSGSPPAEVLAVAIGCRAETAMERSVQRLGVLDADATRHGRDGEVGCLEQLPRRLDSKPLDEGCRRRTGLASKRRARTCAGSCRTAAASVSTPRFSSRWSPSQACSSAIEGVVARWERSWALNCDWPPGAARIRRATPRPSCASAAPWSACTSARKRSTPAVTPAEVHRSRSCT